MKTATAAEVASEVVVVAAAVAAVNVTISKLADAHEEMVADSPMVAVEAAAVVTMTVVEVVAVAMMIDVEVVVTVTMTAEGVAEVTVMTIAEEEVTDVIRGQHGQCILYS